MNEPNEKEICPLNKNCNFHFLYNSTFKNYNLPIYLCKTCGLQKLYPRPSKLKDLYQEDYYHGTASFAYTDERKNFHFHSYVWNSRLNLIQKYKPQGYILEVGSSFGGFLSRAKEYGYEIQGIELSEYSCKYANSIGIPTFHGDLENAPFSKENFDIIVLNEVIEHLPNPKLSLDLLVNILKPNGLLIIQTANFEGWQAKKESSKYHYYLPGHLFYYTESVLRNAFKARGIHRMKIYYGSDISLFSKLMKSSGSFKNAIDYLRWFKTAFYHLKSKLKWKSYPLTSGFVIYGFKGGRLEEREE
ncbi:MAG: class I SAM-dependent methyltransferase [Leptospiraceae bacterium]|nr:class I SAM-dependent methyltransferase [Leptospiraceae bacterium]MCZ8345243.1 class I SAM-dependent methyltransferase [Leptospiraceae bacterium]